MPRQAILISDVRSRVLAGPVQDEGAPGVWRAVPYRSDPVEGVLLGCGETTGPEPVTIRLGAEGRYRIWLGLPLLRDNRIRVRLSGDLCCTPVRHEGHWRQLTEMVEIHWKDADLSGQDLILEGAFNPYPLAGALGWIRLEPVDTLPTPPQRQVAHPMVLTEDGHGIFWTQPHRRPEDILEQYEQVPDGTALKIMLWAICGADATTYPTQVGQVGPGRSRDYHRYGDGMLMRNLDLWMAQGWDSMALPRDYCRKRGWEFHISFRPQAFHHTYPFDEVFRSVFFEQHPEWHCRDAQGTPITRLSYAYPQVQDFMLRLVDEMVAYGPDGINIIFIRGVPLVLYEPIMVEGFQKRHGIDPRTLGEFDPRWLAYQGEVLTGFMRALKARLKPGMRLSAILPGNKFDLIRWGLDVETWVREGIVNDLYPIGQRFDAVDVHDDRPDALDFEYFQTLPGRERVRLFATLYPWESYRADYEGWRRLMQSLLQRGADGYCVWDGVGQVPRVGDIGLSEPADVRPPRQPNRIYPIQTVQGFRVDRYHSIEGF